MTEKSEHVVATSHVQQLIEHGLELAQLANGMASTELVRVPSYLRVDGTIRHLPVDHLLAKAAADLHHAAEELEAERLSVLGWRQA